MRLLSTFRAYLAGESQHVLVTIAKIFLVPTALGLRAAIQRSSPARRFFHESTGLMVNSLISANFVFLEFLKHLGT